ncbi:hypothetical protein VF21_07647 [Pseudogymnoascus sp. 05NY08]|nr:hypothetical protein VF21_07647 [Pseudogymnoascus sp. 05NY08]OBT84301.1 hypothetical protein VE02_07628 [Pseudogymnoascus sp. 03VT05]
MAQAAVGTEKAQTAIATDADPTRGMPYHDKLTGELKQAIMKRRVLERNIMALDETIYKKEGEYLEDTPHGNVLTGFDNYIKSITSNAVGRRKQGVSENDRVFSRSSVRLADFMDSPGGLSTQTTPSGAPTPISAGFGREGSGNATPTSATVRAGVKKKRGKGEGDDSEMEEREGKKARAGARK